VLLLPGLCPAAPLLSASSTSTLSPTAPRSPVTVNAGAGAAAAITAASDARCWVLVARASPATEPAGRRRAHMHGRTATSWRAGQLAWASNGGLHVSPSTTRRRTW
jgi:hypothetical protein